MENGGGGGDGVGHANLTNSDKQIHSHFDCISAEMCDYVAEFSND